MSLSFLKENKGGMSVVKHLPSLPEKRQAKLDMTPLMEFSTLMHPNTRRMGYHPGCY